MNQLVPIASPTIPVLVAAAGDRARIRFLEFFAANIRNPHTRRLCTGGGGISGLVRRCRYAGDRCRATSAVATWIEAGTREPAASSVKQRLAAIRHLFDWLATGQVVPVNPAASVRGPHHVVTSVQTPVLDPTEARALLDSINTSTVIGLRDRALIGLTVYSFARIGAALGMTVEDVFTQNRRLWVRLREKGGKRHAMPRHHNLEEYLTAYLDGGGLRGDPRGRCSARSGGHRPAHAHGPAASKRLCDDRPAHRRRRYCHQARQLISRTAARSKRRRRWRTTPRRARRSFTIAGATSSAWMRSSGS